MKQKKVPMRTCVVTKEKYPKKELIRVVRDNTGKVTVDNSGKQNGRGAYLKKDLEVVDMARKTKALEKYLEVLIPEEVYEELEKAINKFEKSNKEKALIISQTTFSLETFENIVEKIKQKLPKGNIEVHNTICTATKQRQEETEKIAKQVDAMIIIGGKHSSNTNKLYELAKKYCNIVLFIETEKELDEKILNGVNAVGVMAGASTPNESIEKVVEKLKRMC